ncbi:RNA-binding protein Musashi homolog 2 isoform X9 [Lagopus muta]|uniref:RNA-binding protein Musashi homolog 2 isoform X9 n=1 Tax=Lagopus muta TaxID=64668 RepID=UPI00209CDAA3|nr:RNA-binding protein Musashi homolog 2 isoform X9 [Lagopus muta]
MEADGSQATSGGPGEAQHDPGKMFIGGLSWQTSPDSLRDYFSKFGEIRECMVMRDPTTKRSRGFGFVTFADPGSVDKVLAQPHHELDSKTIDPKVAFPRRAQPKMVTRTKKIFVGGLSANTVVEDVKQYFEQFGKDLVSLLLKMKMWWKKSAKSTSTKSIIKWDERKGARIAVHHGRFHAGDGNVGLPEFCRDIWPRISWICPKLQLSVSRFSGSGLWTSSSGGRGGSKRIRLQPSPARRLPWGQQPWARRRPVRHGQPGLRRRQLHKCCQPTAGLRLQPRDRRTFDCNGFYKWIPLKRYTWLVAISLGESLWMSGQNGAKFLSGPTVR